MRPTVAIYQNPDHVAGILQQLYMAPLVTNESREHGGGESSGRKTEASGHGGGKAGVSLPFIGEVGLDAAGDFSRMQENGLTASTKTTQDFTFSQAYYLYVVRDALRQQELVKTVASEADAADLSSGDFVEFQATFKPNALHALLDILTPDLIAAITHYSVKAESLKLFPAYNSVDELKVFSEGVYFKAQIRADIARAVAEAVRVDFRAEKTREFYGTVADVTAVTICDNAHFVVDDEDRILDGAFTVLGKVTSEVERDVPVLSRNKLLDRIGPDVVDTLFGLMQDGLSAQAEKVPLTDDVELDMADAFDLNLPSRIDGASFRVIPVAIFA